MASNLHITPKKRYLGKGKKKAEQARWDRGEMAIVIIFVMITFIMMIKITITFVTAWPLNFPLAIIA
ncbi:MAG: hypothetical protein H6560_04050 [Lewinellaceae bacterium]|nr:hypothetical protein [Lewinellaceae bacterium]